MLRYNNYLKDWITIYFIRDGSTVNILEEDLKHNGEDEWFIPLLFKYKTINNKIIEISEDKRTTMMIIESIRHSKFLLYDNIDLEYLKILSDKWCMPDWFKEKVSEKITELSTYKSNIDTKFQEYLEEQIIECKNCKLGFKLNENKSNSCEYHTQEYCRFTHGMKCCGSLNYHGSYCKVGLHVPDLKCIKAYKELYDSLVLN